MTLKPSCHFSHYSAVQLHELTEQNPHTIYLNHEQPPKPTPATGLAQGRIAAAFGRKPRMTRNIADVSGAGRQGIRVCLLNGMHTGYLGVEERDVRAPGGGKPLRLRLTDIERTLIDIAVRPFYAGGVAEVLKAYRNAAARASVNRIAALLRKLAYVYPYHQAVGFTWRRPAHTTSRPSSSFMSASTTSTTSTCPTACTRPSTTRAGASTCRAARAMHGRPSRWPDRGMRVTS